MCADVVLHVCALIQAEVLASVQGSCDGRMCGSERDSTGNPSGGGNPWMGELRTLPYRITRCASTSGRGALKQNRLDDNAPHSPIMLHVAHATSIAATETPIRPYAFMLTRRPLAIPPADMLTEATQDAKVDPTNTGVCK